MWLGLPCAGTLGKEEFWGTGKVVVCLVTLTPEQKLSPVTYVQYLLMARLHGAM
jgi:hypothetical protein